MAVRMHQHVRLCKDQRSYSLQHVLCGPEVFLHALCTLTTALCVEHH